MAAHQAVGGGEYPGASHRPAAPRHHPCIACRAIGPVPAVHHVVAVVQRRHVDIVIGLAAYQAVGGRDRPSAAHRPAAPRRRPGLDRRAVGPVGTAHHVVAIAQRYHVIADVVAGLAAHQAVGGGDNSSAARCPAAPGRRSGIVPCAIVPVVAAHHVIAIAQRFHAGQADIVVGLAAHQAVGGADYPGAARCPAAPRYGPGLDRRAVGPVGTVHRVVAVA